MHINSFRRNLSNIWQGFFLLSFLVLSFKQSIMNKEIFPTEPSEDGFFYQSEEEKNSGILTKIYDNGSEVKHLELKDGRKASVRKLKGRDFVETKKRMQNDPAGDFETINMSVATTIEGKQQPPEFYLDDLFQDDYAKLMIAFSSLNF